MDTSVDAARTQMAAYRRLGSEGRFEIAWEMSMAVRELALTRLQAKHPNLDDDEVRDLLTWELYGVRRQPR